MKKEIAYYLTLFKIEGHETYRAHLGSEKDSFNKQQNNFTNGVKITDQKTIKIDRLTGELK